MPKENRLQVKKSLKYTPEELVEVLKAHNYYVDLFRKWGKIQLENKKDSWLPEEFRLGGQFEEFIKLDKDGKTWYEKNVNEDGLGVWFDGKLYDIQRKITLKKKALKVNNTNPDTNKEEPYIYTLTIEDSINSHSLYLKSLISILVVDKDVDFFIFEFFSLDSYKLDYSLEHFYLEFLTILTSKKSNNKYGIVFNQLEDRTFLNLILDYEDYEKSLKQNPNFKIIIKNSDLSIQPIEVRKELWRLEAEGRAEFINCIKTELLVERETENSQEYLPKTFEFSRVIKAEHRSAFAQYLTGFANILSKTKNKTLSLKINLNGGLEFVVSSPNPQDLVDIETDLMQYLLNISLVSRGESPFLDISPEADKNESQRALISIKSSIRNFETQIELQDPKMSLEDFKNRVFDKYFQEIKTGVLHISSLTDDLISSRILLLEENKQLKSTLQELKIELKKIQTEQKLETGLNQNLDILVGLIGQVSLALQEKNDSVKKRLIHKNIQEITEFSRKHSRQLQLLTVSIIFFKTPKTVYDFITWLLEFLENYRKN